MLLKKKTPKQLKVNIISMCHDKCQVRNKLTGYIAQTNVN